MGELVLTILKISDKNIKNCTFMNNAELLELLQKHELDSSVRIHTTTPSHKPGKLLFFSDYCFILKVTKDEEIPVGIDPKEYVLIVLLGIHNLFIEISLSTPGEHFSLGEFIKDLRSQWIKESMQKISL